MEERAKAVRSRLRNCDHDVEVMPVVVLWGRARDGVLGDGGAVPVVHGVELRDWLRDRPSLQQVLDVEGVASALETYLRGLKENQGERSRFVAVGAEGVARDISSGITGGVAGIVLASLALSATGLPLLLRVGAVLGLLLFGLALRRWTNDRRRLFGLGLGLASLIVLLVIGALFIVAWALAMRT
jgi:hypothetical protein